MSTQVKLSDIVEGMESQSDEMSSYLNTKTGEIVFVSGDELSVAEEGEGLDGSTEWGQESLETAREILYSDDYTALPSQWDIHEYRIMERFCLSRDDEGISETLYRSIKGRGAFRMFKSAIHRLNIVEDWYRFRDEAFRRMAIDWCEANKIEYLDDRKPGEEDRKPQLLPRRVIYESPWLNLSVDKVRFPDGGVVEQHPLLDFDKEAIGVLVENEREEILLIQAYRYTTDTIEWGIPAGDVGKGESLLDAAKRETLEETGYEMDEGGLTYTYNPMIGISNKVFHIVKGRASRLSGAIDRDEVKTVAWRSLDEIRAMIGEKRIRDGLSLTALLLHLMEDR